MNETHICENCGQEHDGSYGSGRFCSSKCAHAFSFNPTYSITIDNLNSGVLSCLQSFKLKNWLFEHGIKENRCDICGLSSWINLPLECHLHHIDGNKFNNTLSNLEILCPNCHSQTDNYTGKNFHRYMN